MTAVWELVELSPTETLVMLALADHCDDFGGKCYPSIARVAKKARLERRATQAIIRRLEKKGFLTVDRKGLQDGESTNRYQLHVGVQQIHPRGARHDAKGCTPRHLGVHAGAPESSLTIKESSGEDALQRSREKAREGLAKIHETLKTAYKRM